MQRDSAAFAPALSFEEENEALIASHRRKPNPKNW